MRALKQARGEVSDETCALWKQEGDDLKAKAAVAAKNSMHAALLASNRVSDIKKVLQKQDAAQKQANKEKAVLGSESTSDKG